MILIHQDSAPSVGDIEFPRHSVRPGARVKAWADMDVSIFYRAFKHVSRSSTISPCMARITDTNTFVPKATIRMIVIFFPVEACKTNSINSEIYYLSNRVPELGAKVYLS